MSQSPVVAALYGLSTEDLNDPMAVIRTVHDALEHPPPPTRRR